MISPDIAIQNWVNLFYEEPRNTEVKTEKPAPPTIQRSKQLESLFSYTSPSVSFATLRKVYTVGVVPQDFLSAIRPQENTYFGLVKDVATHTTNERLAMLGETLDESLDTGKGFEFPCENKKERKELLLTVATMIPEEWIIRVKGMYLKGVPPNGESDEDY